MKCQHCNNYDIPKPYHVEGSTLTVPGLAPTLIELIEANVVGQPLPLTSQPMYDDNEASGFARVQAHCAVMSDVVNFALSEDNNGNNAVKPTTTENEPLGEADTVEGKTE